MTQSLRFHLPGNRMMTNELDGLRLNQVAEKSILRMQVQALCLHKREEKDWLQLMDRFRIGYFYSAL